MIRFDAATRPGRLASVATSLVAGLLAFAMVAVAQAEAMAGDAKAILKAMSDYVGSQQTIEFTFDSSIEAVTPEMEKVQFTNSGGGLLSRPDKLHAHRVGGYADVEMTFDGETVSVLGKHSNIYAQFEGPATVDELIDALRAGQGIALPGADLLRTDVYDVLVAGVIEAKHIGRGVVDGRECEHLAFRNLDTDWQLWVEVGDAPIPRKLVITTKTLNSAPQYTLQIKDWQTDVEPASDAFVFTVPEGAEQIQPHDLIELDELPPAASAGDQQ
ncbi:DUF2092 domain-containing protein [Thiococcus pfennigii]|uniref:DUF2092 domain-containing protein n=1 Tax=Thiococcus pfennigii TaxID=1057 RepID=UPI0019050B19|nr:DUF2092 domain-containing protein [Thiococcus pfennigii]